MAGQRPIEKSDLCDNSRLEKDFFSLAALSGTIFPLGVATKDMFLEHASLRYGVAEGGAATAYLAKWADGDADTAGNAVALTSTTAFDLNTTVDTAQTAKGTATSNIVKAGEMYGLVCSTAVSTVAAFALSIAFTEKRH